MYRDQAADLVNMADNLEADYKRAKDRGFIKEKNDSSPSGTLPKPSVVEQDVLRQLRHSRMRRRTLVDALGADENVVRQLVTKMIAADLITEKGRGWLEIRST